MPHIVHDEDSPELDVPEVQHDDTDLLPEQREEVVRVDEPVLAGMGGVPVMQGINSVLDPFAPAPTIPNQKEGL